MAEGVVELRPPRLNPEDFREVDSSLLNTAKRSVILGYKLSSLALSKTVGIELPFVRSKKMEHGPNRHVELEPDERFTVETAEGSQHHLDVYGFEHLIDPNRTIAPLVMIMPLALKHDGGFMAPVIDNVSRHAKAQGRPVLVISSEDFADKPMPKSELRKLTFERMAENIHESLDALANQLGIAIPSIITAGGSRGGTLSLMTGSDEIIEKRLMQGLPERRVEGAIAIAPAGLRKLNTIVKKFLVIKQFGIDEGLHMIRKAASLNPEDLEDYIITLLESIPPRRAMPAIGHTAMLFMNEAPLENIGQRMPVETKIRILLMRNDGITTPKKWKDEFSDQYDADAQVFPGFHLSIDNSLKVAGQINKHLDENLALAA